MKKFILPLTVVVLAAGMQLTSFNTNRLSTKHASIKREQIYDNVGTFEYNGVQYQAYGAPGTRNISGFSSPTEPQYGGVIFTASGGYTLPSGGQGTLTIFFTPPGTTTLIHYHGQYQQ